MPESWSTTEVEATVADYFDMLSAELRGERINKAAHNRRLQGLLRGRNQQAIEFKHANISAILIELGYPYISGYKPRYNYQALLQSVVQERLAGATALAELTDALVTAPMAQVPTVPDVLGLEVPAPEPAERPQALAERLVRPSTVRTTPTNFLEREARNSSLGRAGEELALQFEHARLWSRGARDLAERVEHVSRTKGDGLGYDIASFEHSGKPRLIEVKTTRFGPMTPFFASRNEVMVSSREASVFHLCRVYGFTKRPKLFFLSGAIDQTCVIDPVQYMARIA